jgi:hypothetical protein
MRQGPFTHQEPIVVARQLDWRIVEPPRHAAEVLRARLPVRRPAHEAALQRRISSRSAVALVIGSGSTPQTGRDTWVSRSGASHLINAHVRLDVAVVVRQTALVERRRLAAWCLPFVCVHMT